MRREFMFCVFESGVYFVVVFLEGVAFSGGLSGEDVNVNVWD